MTQTVSVFYSTAELPKRMRTSNHDSLETIIYEIRIKCLGILMGSSVITYCLTMNKCLHTK